MGQQASSYSAVWVLADDKPGHRNQAIGVAQALGLPFEVKPMAYVDEAQKPNLFLGSSLDGVDVSTKAQLQPPWPELVIAAGRRTAPVAKYIRKHARKAGKTCYAVQIMWPGFPAWGLDQIVVPAHDCLHPLWKKIFPVMETVGAPHLVTKARLETEAAMWEKTLQRLAETPPRPWVGVLLGGDTKTTRFTRPATKQLAKQLIELAKAQTGSVLITNSRRTPESVVDFLHSALSQAGIPFYLHDIQKERTNPYLAFLGLADILVVTGDSVSMVSEACAAGKPVAVFEPPEGLPSKHRRFLNGLYTRGYAHVLTSANHAAIVARQHRVAKEPVLPLQVAEQVAQMIRAKFLR